MHDIAPLIQDLAVILGVASLVAILFQKIRQPVVLGYLVAGIIVGPYTPPYALISDIPNIKILSELGVIFLMFSLGLEFSFHKLKRLGPSSSIIAFLEVVGMTAIGLVVGLLIGWSFFDSLFLGAALSISSTTIIVKTLEELKLKHKHFSEIIVSILVSEDLIAILLLVMLSTIVITSDIISLELLAGTFKLILVVGGWFLVGYFLVPSIFRHIMPYINEETLTLVSIALCLCLVCIASYFGYSTALGAFIMGSILAETPLIHRIEKLVIPIRNIFAAVFFVSVGMLMDPIILLNEWPIVLLICVVTIVGKLLVTSMAAFFTGQSLTNSVQIGFSMAQIGEFSFIIAGLGLALHTISPEIFPIIVAVSVVTTFTTPYLIKVSEPVAKYFYNSLSERGRYFTQTYTDWAKNIVSNPSQHSIYNKSLIRFLLNAGIIVIIFKVTEQLIFPQAIDLFSLKLLARSSTMLTAVILSSPFIWGMLVAFRSLPNVRTPAANIIRLFSWITTALEVMILGLVYFETWGISFLLLLVVISFFGLLYKQLDKSYQWFENRLLHNLQDKEKWLHIDTTIPVNAENINLIELQVGQNSSFIGTVLQKQLIQKEFKVNVVAITRNTQIILLEKCVEPIQPLDRLLVFGNEEHINNFIQQFSLIRL